MAEQGPYPCVNPQVPLAQVMTGYFPLFHASRPEDGVERIVDPPQIQEFGIDRWLLNVWTPTVGQTGSATLTGIHEFRARPLVPLDL